MEVDGIATGVLEVTDYRPVEEEEEEEVATLVTTASTSMMDSLEMWAANFTICLLTWWG